VNWTGPNSQGDFIAVAAIGSPPGQYIARALSAAGNPVNLFAPRDPGTYELRYVAGKGSEVLATRPLAVK
jgi:Ca-activated chloride channel family protein